jgi:hypothetical protein
MDEARAQPVERFFRIVLLALALLLAIETVDLRDPNPEMPRHVLEGPSENDLGP